jgi:hypothetical protein
VITLTSAHSHQRQARRYARGPPHNHEQNLHSLLRREERHRAGTRHRHGDEHVEVPARPASCRQTRQAGRAAPRQTERNADGGDDGTTYYNLPSGTAAAGAAGGASLCVCCSCSPPLLSRNWTSASAYVSAFCSLSRCRLCTRRRVLYLLCHSAQLAPRAAALARSSATTAQRCMMLYCLPPCARLGTERCCFVDQPG